MMACYASAEPVVPLEASFDVTREADVVAVRMHVAEDVDEAPDRHDPEARQERCRGAYDGIVPEV